MKNLITTALFACIIVLGLTSLNRPHETAMMANSCDISEIYEGIELDPGTKVVTRFENIEEASLILVPTRLDIGKYSVKVNRKANNLYQIDNSEIYIQTSYCYDYAYYKDAVLFVDSYYGFTKGKLVFK